MQALINFIMQYITALWPIARIYSWQQGVRVRCGVLKEELGPGIHWRWWFVDEVYRVSVAEDTADLKPIAITTTDGRAVTASAAIAYRVRSVRQMWRSVNSLGSSIANVALGFLAAECARRSLADLAAQRAQLQADMQRHMTETLDAWGVEVTRVYLTDFVEARQYRLFGDVPTVRVG